MATYYVGLGGNDGNNGLTWALRKLTLNGAEDIPVAVGDVVYVGPGVYREQLTVDVSGGSVYQAGTVSVTNGSTTVTGAGTAFLANVAAADQFHVRLFASAADGVTNGTAAFTSAGGNFQANMVGRVIQINTRGAYGIGAVAAANSITLTDPNGLGWPAAAVGLTYSVMSGEDHHGIDSVTDNTNFELVRPWYGPTLTGLAYITFTPITYIGDVTGESTDGVGGIVRITGSDNDLVPTRNFGILATPEDYRLFRGFSFDSTLNAGIRAGGPADHWIVEDCNFFHHDAYGIRVDDDSICWTIRRCELVNCFFPIYFIHTVAHDDAAHVVSNAKFIGNAEGTGFSSVRIGGITLRNALFIGCGTGARVIVAVTVGQTMQVNNTTLCGCGLCLRGTVVGEVTEDFNDLTLNFSDRLNVTAGANSQTYLALLLPPILHAGAGQASGFQFPWWFGSLSEWSAMRAIVGLNEPCNDLVGAGRPVTSAKNSWGPLQFTDMERDTGTVYAGVASMEISDAGRVQFKVPIAAESTTVEVYVQREANYAGVNPQLVIKQPGQADRTTTDAGAAGAWNLLTDTFTPAALPPYVFIELVSNNTNGANVATYWDNLRVG